MNFLPIRQSFTDVKLTDCGTDLSSVRFAKVRCGGLAPNRYICRGILSSAPMDRFQVQR